MSKWYEWDDELSVDENREKRLRKCPLLSPAEFEVLRQLRKCVWDGYIISKYNRDKLVDKGLVTRWNGWQVLTQEGMAVLDTLGYLRDGKEYKD